MRGHRAYLTVNLLDSLTSRLLITPAYTRKLNKKLFPRNFRPFEKATVVNFENLSSGSKVAEA